MRAMREECETCAYYDTDRDDMPCYSCDGGENWEEADEKRELFNNILHHGTFGADFGCTNHLGMNIRVRTADYNGKKYFIVMCDGNITELLEI